MGGGIFDKVAPGESLDISAATHNAMLDAARAHQERQQALLAPPRSLNARPGMVWLTNDSGADQDQFAVLGLSGVAITPATDADEFKREVSLVGVVPDVDEHRGRFAVLAEPIADGEMGLAYVDDVVQVRLDNLVDAPICRFAGIVDGVTGYLETQNHGTATILWQEDPETAGEQWAIVRLGRRVAVFSVLLVKVGGAAGDASTACSWVYDIKDPLTAAALGSAVDPTAAPHLWQRGTVGEMKPATFGMAWWDDAGTLRLTWINEAYEPHIAE